MTQAYTTKIDEQVQQIILGAGELCYQGTRALTEPTRLVLRCSQEEGRARRKLMAR